ncbi:DNA sulfur modification protein DndB [Paenibacillus polymyxa]|uniref:DNA sulfur modification protein DndB n=1 Tax=Paenibacillus polymyxa TaxID=1406 RepID=UPI00287FAE00|nr:DNA sulfur modification protein DndB [Paenibacillus polymyxa]
MEIDLSNIIGQSNFLTFKALRGNQFGKNIMSFQCTAEQVLKFIAIDSEVQRDIIDQHVAEIQQYIQYGIDGHNIYFPPLIFSARGNGNYDNEKKEYKLHFNEKLVLLDGQHRMKAFEMIVKRLEIRDDEFSREKLKFIRNFPLTLQVFTHLSIDEEKQLFTDVNTKSSKANNSLLIMYKNHSLCGELTKDIIFNHPTISSELFEVRAKYTRTKFMTAATLYNIIITLNEGLIHTELLKSKITQENYDEYKKNTERFLDLLIKVAPYNTFNRSQFVIYIPKVLSGIAYFVSNALKEHPEMTMEQIFNLVIAKIDWSHKNMNYKNLGIPYNENTKKYNFANGTRGIKIISKYLTTKLEEVLLNGVNNA